MLDKSYVDYFTLQAILSITLITNFYKTTQIVSRLIDLCSVHANFYLLNLLSVFVVL